MRVRVFNRNQVEELEPNPEQVVISISTPGHKPATLKEGWEDVLRLQFHDVIHPEPALTPFNEEMAEVIHSFIGKHLGKDFVIHCDAGRSRSVAVGLFLNVAYDYQLAIYTVDTMDPIRFANDFGNRLVFRTLQARLWRAHFDQ